MHNVDYSGDIASYTRGGTSIPAPPKKGELMICQFCGKPIYPEQFSKNSFQRKYEFKWHLHPECRESMDSIADRGVPGLIQERQKAQQNAQR